MEVLVGPSLSHVAQIPRGSTAEHMVDRHRMMIIFRERLSNLSQTWTSGHTYSVARDGDVCGYRPQLYILSSLW